MFRRWNLLACLAAVLIAVTLAVSCADAPEQVLEPTPESLTPEQPEIDMAPLLGLRLGSFRDYRLIRQPIIDQLLRQIRLIGPEGGLIRLGGHLLEVPAGAVDRPALFSMLVLPTGYVEVELLALAPLLSRVLDIGSDGFEEPVSLTLSYARATNVRDPDDLFVLRLNPFGRHEPLPSRVDKRRRTVTAELEHFSRYCLASN